MIQTTGHALTIRKTLPFPRARVYAAWTQPEQMVKWMGPDGYTVRNYVSDPRVGGAYSLEMVSSGNEVIGLRGEYREIREPEFLQYTWTWVEDTPEEETETLVTVSFDEVDGGTELTLTHELLKSAESAEGHTEGWTQAVDKFAAYLAAA